MVLEFGGRVIGVTKVVGIRGGTALGFHRLFFDVQFDMYDIAWGEGVTLTNVSGDVAVGAVHLGRLQSQSVLSLLSPRLSSNMQVELEMTRARLELLEELRLGGGLEFTIWLRGCLSSISRESPRSNHLPHQGINEQLHHQVNQSTWLHVLEDLQYQRTMVLEIPLLTEVDGSQAAWVQHLRHAHQAMTQGRWREAVGKCRDVLESFEAATRATDAERPELPKARRTWSKSQRYWNLQHAVMTLTHAARHADQLTQAIDWEREDAQAMLLMTASIVRRQIRITNEKEKATE